MNILSYEHRSYIVVRGGGEGRREGRGRVGYRVGWDRIGQDRIQGTDRIGSDKI